MAWTDLTFGYGTILTSTQMTQLDANLDALAAGASGAPTIQNSAIAGSAIHAPHLSGNITTATWASSVGPGNHIIGSSGVDFYPMVISNDGGTMNFQIAAGFHWSSAYAMIYYQMLTSTNFSIVTRSVSASSSETWIYGLIDKSSGELREVQTSGDAPLYGDEIKPHPFWYYPEEKLEGNQVVFIHDDILPKIAHNQNHKNCLSYLLSKDCELILSEELPKDIEKHYSEWNEFTGEHKHCIHSKLPDNVLHMRMKIKGETNE